MAETLTIELKDSLAAGPLPPPPAPPAYAPPAPPSQSLQLPLRPPAPPQREAAPPVPAEVPHALLARLSDVLDRLARGLARLPVAPSAPAGTAGPAPAAPPAGPAPAPLPPAGLTPPPAATATERAAPTPKAKRLAWDDVQALFGLGPMPPPPPGMPPPPAGFDFGPLPPSQERPAQAGPVVVQAPDVTVEAPQAPAPVQPAPPRPELLPRPDDSAERLEAKRRQALAEREAQIRREQERLRPTSEFEQHARPELRVNPDDDPQLADAKRRQQHAEYEQEVYRLRKALAPPPVPEPEQPGDRLKNLGQIGQVAGMLPGGQAAAAVGTGLRGLGQLQAAIAPGGAAAAGGLAGAAAAAGPIAMIAMAAIELRDQVREGLRSKVEGIGQTIKGVASLDAQMLDRAVEHGLTSALERAGGVLPALGLIAPAAGETLKQAREVVDASVGTARRFSNVNGPLAAAFGQAEVRHLTNEMSRARLASEKLVGVVEANSRKEEAQQNAQTLALAALAPLLQAWEEEQASFWEQAYVVLQEIARLLNVRLPSRGNGEGTIDEILGGDRPGWWPQLADALDRARPERPPINRRRPPLGAFP